MLILLKTYKKAQIIGKDSMLILSRSILAPFMSNFWPLEGLDPRITVFLNRCGTHSPLLFPVDHATC